MVYAIGRFRFKFRMQNIPYRILVTNIMIFKLIFILQVHVGSRVLSSRRPHRCRSRHRLPHPAPAVLRENAKKPRETARHDSLETTMMNCVEPNLN